jgi:hypothetical protein
MRRVLASPSRSCGLCRYRLPDAVIFFEYPKKRINSSYPEIRGMRNNSCQGFPFSGYSVLPVFRERQRETLSDKELKKTKIPEPNKSIRGYPFFIPKSHTAASVHGSYLFSYDVQAGLLTFGSSY